MLLCELIYLINRLGQHFHADFSFIWTANTYNVHKQIAVKAEQSYPSMWLVNDLWVSIAKTAIGICGISRCFYGYFAMVGRFFTHIGASLLTYLTTSWHIVQATNKISLWPWTCTDGSLVTFGIVEFMENYMCLYNGMWWYCNDHVSNHEHTIPFVEYHWQKLVLCWKQFLLLWHGIGKLIFTSNTPLFLSTEYITI